MKHDKFIELLNLYLDGALPAGSVAEMEREIAQNPERRKIYRQYCQMQRACTLLSERFREDSVPAAVFRGGAVLEARQAVRPTWFRPVGLMVGGAAAACVAFVLVQSRLPNSGEASVAASSVAPTASAVARMSTGPAETMPVSTGSFSFFRDPWHASTAFPNRAIVWSQLPQAERELLLAPPVTQLPSGETANGKMPIDPQTLRSEEIQAAAFQFQR